jgi:hypothetical protein
MAVARPLISGDHFTRPLLPGEPVRNWRGIESIDPPSMHTYWPELAAMAVECFQNRKARYPDMVRQRALSEEQARIDLAAWRAIALHWRWLTTGFGLEAQPDTLDARITALDASIDTLVDIARQSGGFDAETEHKANLIIALRWHAEQPPERALSIARMNHLLRQLAAQQEQAA